MRTLRILGLGIVLLVVARLGDTNQALATLTGQLELYVDGEAQRRVSRAFKYLYTRMDTYQSGSTPRLIETYNSPYTGPYTQYRADVYSNALVILALLRRGAVSDISRAKILGDGIVYVQSIDPGNNADVWIPAPDGRVRDAYWATNLNAPPPGGPSMFKRGSLTGNLSWAINALTELYKATGDVKYLNSAKWMGDFVITTYKDTNTTQCLGGFWLGYATDWNNPPLYFTLRKNKSMEHHFSLYVAFSKLASVDADPKWTQNAAHAFQFVTNPQLFNSGGNPPHYWVGSDPGGACDVVNSNPLQQALDANAYPILLGLGSQSLPWAETLKVTHHGYQGFDFNTDVDGVWFEGTAVMSLVYIKKMGDLKAYRKYLNQLRLIQDNTASTWPYADGSLASACHDWLTTGFTDLTDFYFNVPDIAATAWYILAEYQKNPLKF